MHVQSAADRDTSAAADALGDILLPPLNTFDVFKKADTGISVRLGMRGGYYCPTLQRIDPLLTIHETPSWCSSLGIYSLGEGPVGTLLAPTCHAGSILGLAAYRFVAPDPA